MANQADVNALLYHIFSQEEKLNKGHVEDPVVTLVDEILHSAITLHSSDIHLQPQENAFVIRYRIDGILYDQKKLPATQAPLVVSRLKVLANLDIAERRIPQDGRFRATIGSNTVDQKNAVIDFRVATFPTLYGEKMVLRILDRSLRLLALDALGLQQDLYDQLKAITQRQHGLFLVTGPTGCGKSTMLYALISALNMHTKNIVTIEDPIEYELSGITQSQVNPKIGFTFENGLRAILRQDPDVIMIGEIRDKATAHIAIESALTGHLVLSTLHTNDASSAVARLLEMGVEPFLISATLSGVLAQRLVRRLCDVCKKEEVLPAFGQELLRKSSDAEIKAYGPQGCKECSNIGYKGRIGLFELLTINDIFRELIMSSGDAASLRKEARKQAMKTIFCDGLEKLKAGITSLDEIMLIKVDEAMSE